MGFVPPTRWSSRASSLDTVYLYPKKITFPAGAVVDGHLA